VKTGQVHGMTAARHTSQDFIVFLEGLVARPPWATEIHVVLDNLSAHKTKDVAQFLAEHPQVAISLHADLLIVTQPGRTMVRQDPARRYPARRVHLRGRSRQQVAQIYPSLFEIGQAIPMDVLGSHTQNSR
jgi:DDE superfamily endonuclease